MLSIFFVKRPPSPWLLAFEVKICKPIMEGTNNVAAALIIEEGQTKGSQNQESGATSAHTVGHGLYYCSFLYSF